MSRAFATAGVPEAPENLRPPPLFPHPGAQMWEIGGGGRRFFAGSSKVLLRVVEGFALEGRGRAEGPRAGASGQGLFTPVSDRTVSLAELEASVNCNTVGGYKT